MRWSFSSTTNIITGIIYIVAILVFLFIARIILLYLVNGELSLDKIFKPREITPNELSMRVGQNPFPEEPAVSELSVADSSGAVKTNVIDRDTISANTVSSNTVKSNTVKSNTVKSNTSSANTASANPVTINTISLNEVHASCYIIIGSFRNIVQAKEKVEKTLSDFNANIIILPPTKEGYYRISYGKYASHEEAEAAINSIRKKIKSDAWILTVKE